ncbi:MAG: SDR family NAD(P)-dependent oxidoreductase [Pseudomonadota bacterium]
MTSQGLNVWITGASQGLGEALALNYLSKGAEVAITARRQEALEIVREESVAPERCWVRPGDVTNREDVEAIVNGLERSGAAPDIAILNAGTYQHGGLEEISSEAARGIFELNVFSVITAIEILRGVWRRRGGGHLVVVGSVAGDVGLPYAALYSATKASVRRILESLQPELERENVRVTLVSPGFVRTPLTEKNDFPMPFIVSAEDAAEAIHSGVSKQRFEVRYPRRMGFLIRFIAALPYWLKFRVTAKMLR